jgi:predicted hydrolase (HD superfamily)
MFDRTAALALLHEYVQSDSLRKHMLGVEAAMRWHATAAGCSPDEIERCGLTGLLHDFDYERYPEPTPPNGHPFKGNEILTALGYPEDIRAAIMGHATYTNVARTTRMAQTLFAVDELSGLITASVLVRPDKNIFNLEAKSVLKKMKDKAFARGCNRDDIKLGAAELGVDLEVHITNVIAAMRGIAPELGLAGAEAGAGAAVPQ